MKTLFAKLISRSRKQGGEQSVVSMVIGGAIALFVTVLLISVSMTLLTGTSTTGWSAGLISIVFNLPIFLAIVAAIGILVGVVVVARRAGG